MSVAEGAIVVERLDEERYRATCPLFPDCQTVAPTAEEARQALAEAVERILRDRDTPAPPSRGGD